MADTDDPWAGDPYHVTLTCPRCGRTALVAVRWMFLEEPEVGTAYLAESAQPLLLHACKGTHKKRT